MRPNAADFEYRNPDTLGRYKHPYAVAQNYFLNFCICRTQAAILLGVQTWAVCGVHNLIPPIYVAGSTWTFFESFFLLPIFLGFFISRHCNCTKNLAEATRQHLTETA